MENESTPWSQAVRTWDYGQLNQPIKVRVVLFIEPKGEAISA